MVVSDFDGVFTDGSIYLSENNDVQKRLNFQDIMGVSILIKNNIKFAIISGEEGNILNYFNDKFHIEDIYGGIRQKGIKLQEVMEKYGLKSDEIAYIGDDINDIPAFELVDYKIAPKNLNPVLPFEVNNLKVTSNFGGSGAFRELVDELIEARNKDMK